MPLGHSISGIEVLKLRSPSGKYLDNSPNSLSIFLSLNDALSALCARAILPIFGRIGDVVCGALLLEVRSALGVLRATELRIQFLLRMKKKESVLFRLSNKDIMKLSHVFGA